MGLRLKILISILGVLGVYAFYYFALPNLIDLDKFQPLIKTYIKNEYGFNVKIENPKFKTALSPALWLKADKFAIINDDGSEVMTVEKPLLKVTMLPLIIGRLHVKYFDTDKISLKLHCDDHLRLSLGQYLLINTSNFILDINGGSVYIDKFLVDFTSDSDNKKIIFDGHYFNIDKYIKNKVLKSSMGLDIITQNKRSKVYFNLDTKLPFNKHLDKYPPELSLSITNLELSDYTSLIKSFTKNSISDISGFVNAEVHSDKKIFEQKQYISSIIINNFKCNSKYLLKPYNYPHKIELASHVLLEKQKLNIPSIALKTPKFTTKISGSIDNITSKNPIQNIDIKMFGAQAHDILELIPSSKEFDDMIKISVSVAKEANFNADVDIDLKLKGDINQPDVFGTILVDNAYVFEPIQKAPRGAFIGLEYKGDYLDLYVNVPTDKAQEVNVTGKIDVYGEQACDIHITSTQLIDLALVKKVLMPVHKTFRFLLGPVPIMQFAGYGSIDLKVKATRKDPHTYGWFKTQNATTYFDDAKDFVLKNADSLLTFDDFDTKFTLKSGTINGKPVSIDGTCNLDGNFNFDVKAPKQDLGDLLHVLKTSPLLGAVQNSAKMLETASGASDFSMNLKGHLLDISDMDLGKNVHAKGDLKLYSNSVKLAQLALPISNLSGDILFNDLDYKLNLVSKIANSKILVSGGIKNDKATISFNSENIRLSDLVHSFKNPYIEINRSAKVKDSSFAQFKGNYNGSIEKFDFTKLHLSGSVNFKNLNIIYKKANLPVYVQNGIILIENNDLNIRNMNVQAGTAPALIYGSINDFLRKPKLNINIKAEPNQRFMDSIYNKSAIYPVKIKGHVAIIEAISGYLDNLNISSTIKIDKASSLYYMGSTIGDGVYPIYLISNANLKQNQVDLKSFVYDKFQQGSGKHITRERQLSASGQLAYSKDNIYFKNFKVKTNVQTDMRIFNIIFKKPLIKKGMFSSDVIVNGSLKNPSIRGIFDISGMDIPFFDANVEHLSLKFLDNRILGAVKGDVLSNKFKLDFNAKNSLYPQIVVNSVKFDIGNFNVDQVLEAFDKFDLISTRESSSTEVTIPNFVDLNKLVINNFEIVAKSIDLNNLHATNLKSNVSLRNGNFKLENFKFNLAKGSMEGSGGYNLRSKRSNFDLEVKGVDADNLLSTAFDVRGQLYGDLGGKLSLSCSGDNQRDCLRTLDGHTAFLIKDGRMPKLGSLEYLLKAGNLIKGGITGVSINGIIDLITPLKTGNFESIKGAIEIHNGIADKIQILSTGKDLSIFVTGEYNLSTYVAKMNVFGRLSKKISTVLGPLGNVSLNTLFNAIPGVDLSDPTNAALVKDINKLPMIELSDKAFRVFAVEIFGNINGNNYVQSFRWIE